MKPVRIGDHLIGEGAPFVIAEMSGNHNRSLERALAIVDAAADSGAHALKLQTYTPETMTLELDSGEFFIDDPDNPWAGQSLYQLYGEANTPWEWHAAIFEHCRQRGVVCFSSPFDETAVDFLETLDAPAYKIASFENSDLPLIRRAAATGKPLIISTGMATLSELGEAVEAARGAGCRELLLLKCTSTYPASPASCNLATIPHLRQLFGCQVGLSDHTLGIGVALAATALGATVIEKHFTLDRADGGVDAAFSMEPAELRQLVEESARAAQAMGDIHYGAVGTESASLKHRRSLYIAQDLKAGTVLNEENLRRVRPGMGLAPKHFETVLGMAVSRDVAKGTPLSWDLLKPAE